MSREGYLFYSIMATTHQVSAHLSQISGLEVIATMINLHAGRQYPYMVGGII